MERRWLREDCHLKALEEPSLYDASADELYTLDREAFERLSRLDQGAGDPEAEALLAGEGLLQDRPRTAPSLVPGRSPVPSLRYLEVQVTARCDKACRHCYLGEPAAVDLAPADLAALLDQFSALQGLKVMVSGGEPRRHPAWREVMGSLLGTPFRRVLVTHGEGIDAAEARRLGAVFHQVQVSLDGWVEGHDRLRGRGAFERATAGLRSLRGEGVPVAVGTMVHAANLDEFGRLSDLLRETGVEEWSIDVPCPAGRWTGGDADLSLLRTMAERLRHAYGGGYHGGSNGLACGSHLMTVFPDGTAAKCGFYRHLPLGDARRGLVEAWARLGHTPLERLRCRCPQLESCGGGCRYRAEVLGGDPLAEDLVQCYARGVR